MTSKFAVNARRVVIAAGFAAVGALPGGTSAAAGSPQGMSPPDQTLGVLTADAAANERVAVALSGRRSSCENPRPF